MIRCLLAAALALLIGCTNANVALNAPDVPLEARKKNHTRATTLAGVSPQDAPVDSPAVVATSAPSIRAPHDSTSSDPRDDGRFIGLALSGGGSRSSNFSAACMFQLQRLGILQRVDYISSVSGGSLTGAFYCLSDDREWNPQTAQRGLTHSFASDVLLQTCLPWNWPFLAFSDWDRSDILADSFESHLFRRDGRALTFADLRADRPRLLINSTDLQSSRPFVFCDESFDEINSDLSKYPVANAVAASAAVPVVMHQVTLRDFATSFKQYRHLIDGGVHDNLGITTLVETYEAHIESAKESGKPDPYPRGALLIVLDARTRFDARLDDKGDIGLIDSLATGASATSSNLLNRVSSATMAEIIVKYSPDEVTAKQLRAQVAQLQDEGVVELHDRRGHRVTVVHLSLARVAELSELPSQGFFQRLNDIATYFNISDVEAASLYQAANLLMKEKYERYLLDAMKETER